MNKELSEEGLINILMELDNKKAMSTKSNELVIPQQNLDVIMDCAIKLEIVDKNSVFKMSKQDKNNMSINIIQAMVNSV